MSVELKAADRKLLEEAIKSLGWQYAVNGNAVSVYSPNGTITIANDQASFQDRAQNDVNKIKQAYSFQTVKAMAKKYKFNVVNKEGKLVLRRY